MNEGVWRHKGTRLRVAAFDYGIKYNILRCLEHTGCEVVVVPAGPPSVMTRACSKPPCRPPILKRPSPSVRVQRVTNQFAVVAGTDKFSKSLCFAVVLALASHEELLDVQKVG